MGLFDRLKKRNLSEKTEELRKSLVELEALKRRSLLDSIEYKRIQGIWAPCQEAIEKGEATESLISLQDKYTKSIVKIKANLEEQAEKQETLRKGITTLLSKNPALLPLLFTDDFMPEGSFNFVLCSLVKGHKEGKPQVDRDQQQRKLFQDGFHSPRHLLSSRNILVIASEIGIHSEPRGTEPAALHDVTHQN